MTENNVANLMTQDQTQQGLESLTKEEVCASDSDSGVGSPRTSEESSRSPVSSRRSSVNSVSSSVGGNNNLQKETKDQTQPKQVATEEPKMQENENLGGQAKDPVKSEEKKDKKNATPIVQKPSANRNNSESTSPKKQPNNRNLHVAFAAGCAFLAVGCLVAAAIAKSGILCVIGAVFAIAAITTWCLTPSSELTSTNLSPLVDGKQR